MLRQRTITGIRAIALVCCIGYAVSGHKPPAIAQQPTAADVHRDDQLTVQHDAIAEMKDTEHLQGVAIQVNANTIAGMQGENRILFGILGILMGGSITLQLRGKKKE